MIKRPCAAYGGTAIKFKRAVSERRHAQIKYSLCEYFIMQKVTLQGMANVSESSSHENGTEGILFPSDCFSPFCNV